MGGGSSTPSNITQTTKTEPPKWVQPYATDLLGRSSTLSKQPYQSYPYYTVAGLQPEHYVAMNQISQRALGGAPTVDAGLGYLQNLMSSGTDYGPAYDYLKSVMGGNYLGGNPFIRGAYETAARRFTDQYTNATYPGIQAAASRAGAFGGSAHRLLESETNKSLGQQLSDLANQMYFQNYATERGYQMGAAELLSKLAQEGEANRLRAAAMTPMMEQAGYLPQQALMGVGDIYRQYEADQLADYYRRWQEQQQWPYSQLSFLGQMIPAAIGNWGTSTTTGTNPNYNPVSPMSTIMGGAMSGIGTGLAAASLLGSGAGMTGLSAGIGALPFIASLFSL